MQKLRTVVVYRLLVIITVAMFVTFPTVVAAQNGFVTCAGLDCQFCHLVSTGQNVLNWLVLIMAVVAGLLFAYAGLTLVTSAGNRTAQEKARNIFNNVIIGYLIVLAGWLLIDTTFKMLVNQDMLADGAEIGPWNRVVCVAQPTPAEITTQLTAEALEGFTDSWSLYQEGGEGWFLDDAREEPLDLEDFEGCDGIVEFAQQMMAKGCQYSQAHRNGCQGTPGYTDCSDLVNISYRAAGCSSPGTYTGNQISSAEPIGDRSSLQRGDAIIWRTGGRGHVAICMNQGCSQIIEARGQRWGIVTGSSARMLNRSDIRVIRCQRFCGN